MTQSRIPWGRLAAEFCVIVVGVLVALAADDWRQSRDDRAREQALMNGLHSDLVADSIGLAQIQLINRRWDESSVWLQRRMRMEPVPPVDSVSAQISGVIFHRFYQPVNAAYASLTQAGEMSLIRDPTLRRRITEYYEVRQPYMLQFQDHVMNAWYVWSEVFWDYVDVPLPADSSRHWPAEFRFVGTWQDFEADPRVRPALTSIGVFGGNRAQRVAEVLEANRELAAALRAEIGPR